VSEVVIKAEKRTQFGKGAARKIRRNHKVPAVLYGHGQDVVHLSLPAREFAAVHVARLRRLLAEANAASDSA